DEQTAVELRSGAADRGVERDGARLRRRRISVEGDPSGDDRAAAVGRHGLVARLGRLDRRRRGGGDRAVPAADPENRKKRKQQRPRVQARPSDGAEENRTPDLFNAIEALYQLSYSPESRPEEIPHASGSGNRF